MSKHWETVTTANELAGDEHQKNAMPLTEANLNEHNSLPTTAPQYHWSIEKWLYDSDHAVLAEAGRTSLKEPFERARIAAEVELVGVRSEQVKK